MLPKKNIYLNELHHNVLKFVEICLVSYISTCFGSNSLRANWQEGLTVQDPSITRSKQPFMYPTLSPCEHTTQRPRTCSEQYVSDSETQRLTFSQCPSHSFAQTCGARDQPARVVLFRHRLTPTHLSSLLTVSMCFLMLSLHIQSASCQGLEAIRMQHQPCTRCKMRKWNVKGLSVL